MAVHGAKTQNDGLVNVSSTNTKLKDYLLPVLEMKLFMQMAQPPKSSLVLVQHVLLMDHRSSSGQSIRKWG